MDKDTLKAKLNTLEMEYLNKRKAVYAEYAMANNPYKIGDVIKDHIGIIEIRNIKTSVSGDSAECVYKGLQLNKDGKTSRLQNHTKIYQSNIIE